MSVAFTEKAVRDQTKTVTRRKGWWEDKNGRRMVKPGDRITLCRKVMGRKKGEPLERICDVEVVDVRREPLSLMLTDLDYGFDEIEREGMKSLDVHFPSVFVERYFINAQGMSVDDEVTRIEWRYLEADQ
jgi:hypothetical protein